MGEDPVRVPIEGELDLHAFAPRDIPSVVSEYIDAAAAAGLLEVRLVHGRGRVSMLIQAHARNQVQTRITASGTRLAISHIVANPGTKQTITAATARRAQALTLPLSRAASTRWP